MAILEGEVMKQLYALSMFICMFNNALNDEWKCNNNITDPVYK